MSRTHGKHEKGAHVPRFSIAGVVGGCRRRVLELGAGGGRRRPAAEVEEGARWNDASASEDSLPRSASTPSEPSYPLEHLIYELAAVAHDHGFDLGLSADKTFVRLYRPDGLAWDVPVFADVVGKITPSEARALTDRVQAGWEQLRAYPEGA